jgi:heme exporter protein D
MLMNIIVYNTESGGLEMENSIFIALIAVIVSLLALPMSYFVAVRQVKVGLNEFEKRAKRKARILVADRLDEFYRIFYAAVNEYTGIENNELQHRLKEIDPYLLEIDTFTIKSGILERLAKAIDDLSDNGYSDLQLSSDLVLKIQGIRGQIAIGSDIKRYVTLGIISACDGDNLQKALRKI